MNTKVVYQSNTVYMAEGPDAVEAAAKASGHSTAHTEAMLNFAYAILTAAQQEHLDMTQCYTGCLNAMCLILNNLSNTTTRANLVGATTEALCAYVGGGSDKGVHQ